MRSRLFWKILLSFWLTMVVTTGAIILNNAARRAGGLSAVWADSVRHRAGFIPMWPVALHLAAGLVVSAVLAAYFTRPITHLRTGFRSLSFGDLGTRLTPSIGGRRDEIADLARDFDAMAERLQTLVGTRDRLLHDVSHELRSPLARLGVAVALARQNRELIDQTLDRIEAESARLNLIVEDLLSLARAESDAAVEEIYFDVGEVLQVVCADAQFEAQPRDVEVRLELSPAFAEAPHGPLVSGDPELLHRALENVVRNALRFTPPGKCVEVKAWIADTLIHIHISDQGPGVPAALLEQIFEPFVKGSGDARGVGLGLAIARRAVAAHDGQLEATNMEGGGLLMRLSLPVAADLEVSQAV